MPHKRTFAVEILETDELRNTRVFGFVPSELEDWDYTNARAGTVQVKKMPNGRFVFVPLEGAAEAVFRDPSRVSERVTLSKEIRRAFT